MMITIRSQEPQDTKKLGQKLAKHLNAGDIVCLHGELGAGKTTFVKGLAAGLKISQDEVSSPTFVLMNIYEGRIPLYHFDLYRLDKEDEIRSLDCNDFFYGEGISVVEWAEKLGSFVPQEYLIIHLYHQKDQGRKIKISAVGQRYRNKLKKAFPEKGQKR